jgi:AraC-like DNA-binding protein
VTDEDVPGLATTTVRPLAHGLARLGVDPVEFLSAVGLEGPSVEGFVPDIRLARALHRIASVHRIEHLGIELARNLPLGLFGNTDYRFSTSATFADALISAGAQLNDLTFAVRFELHLDEHTARIQLRHLTQRPEILTELSILTEFSAAIVVRRFRDVLVDPIAELTGVQFLHPAPPSTKVHEEFFRAPVTFEAPIDQISFSRALLLAPLLTADPFLADALAHSRRPTASNDAESDPFLARLRATIAASLERGQAALGVDVIAVGLQTSGRSLQRKLREREQSLSGLIDEVRRARASELLSQDGILLCDVAYLLGFSSVGPFFRAFRRWTGTSPRAFQGRGSTP